MKNGIIAFAFGAPETIASNRLIAELASQGALRLNAPIYTQLDIQIKNEAIKVEFSKEQPGNPPPTLRIARSAIQWARRENINRLWIVAAKPHLKRCMRDVLYAIKESGLHFSLNIYVCDDIRNAPENEWFCADSTQSWTRSQKDWDQRENIISKMPFSIYKLIARIAR